jgi:hypothetical protein
MIIEGHVAVWREYYDHRGVRVREVTIEVQGHSFTVPWIGDDFDAPPPGRMDTVRCTFELLREPDPRGV